MAILAASENELHKLKQMFRDLDSDKNGQLNKQEIQEGFQNLKKDLKLTRQKSIAPWSELEYDEILVSMDRNGDGSISTEEFIAAAIDKAALLTAENIKRTFNLIDEDGSGYLSIEELKKAFTSNDYKSEE